MRVLSLFDGMACGMLAMMESGIQVDRYVAFEIDKYAIQTATHNFPMIEQRGDVFKADFTEFKGFDYLIGGSPCTYWSIAQKNNRETEASGMGWELLSQFVRALIEAEPRFFLYENNKSMSNAIRQSISEAFGFEPIYINSALVSAQNRQRLYWVGRRNEDGTYSKIDIPQPEDRGILLKDILETGCTDLMSPVAVEQQLEGRIKGNDRVYEARTDSKAACCTSVDGRRMVAEPCCLRYIRTEEGKALRKDYESGTIHHGFNEHRELQPREDKKSNTVSTVMKDNPIAEPVCVASRGRNPENPSSRVAGEHTEQRFEAHTDGKTNTVTSVTKDNLVGEPVRGGTLPQEDGTVSESKQYRVYSAEGKSTTLCGEGGGLGAKTGLYALACGCYACPVEFDEFGKPTKARSCADEKTYTVYEVADGQITIKGKTYPIKLTDGFWIIRKLTVRECARLQTIPEWFVFPVSDTQAYRQIGNGWTVQVIAHLLNYTKEG